MKILILGGTGAMGLHLSKLLAEKGAQVSVTTRQVKLASNGIQYIQGNAKDDDFLRLLVAKPWDCIVDFMAYSTSDFQRRLSILLSNTQQYFFLSSARVYADSEQPITENSPRLLDVSQDAKFLQTDEYALAKARQEDLLKASGKKNWTIIRPYITYAEERLQLGVLEKENWLFRALQGRTIVFCNEILQNTTTLTYGRDVAKAMVSLIGCGKALGETFHITSEFRRSWEEILKIYCQTIAELTGKDPKLLNVGLDEFMETYTGHYQIIYDRLYNRVFDNSKINSFISTEDFVTPEKGLKANLDLFLKDQKFLSLSSRGEGRRDFLTGEMTPLDNFFGVREKGLYLTYRYNLKNRLFRY